MQYALFERRIEEAGLNSWPAFEQLLFDGWVARFAHGYTGRANSVTLLYPSLLPLAEKIAWGERFFQEKQLSPAFRILSFLDEGQQVDQLLEQRGYSSYNPTQVWAASLSSYSVSEQVTMRAISLAEWLALYAQWSERFPDLQHRHRELLERITLPTLYAALYVQDTCVACGLGVLDHEALGLFDIVTAPAQRRQGYGTQLVMAILAWGKQRGAQYAHLQVVQDNLAAQQMYTKLGFHHYYHYWYRVRRS